MIVFLGGLGLLFDDIPRGARPFWINVHVCVGLIYFAAVIARVLWRTTHKAPDLRPDIGEFSRRTSFAVHHLLYVLMLLIPVVGVVARVWQGRGFDYGVFQLDFGAASDPAVFHLAEKIHQLLAYALFALAGLAASNADARRLIRGGGARVNDAVVTEEAVAVTAEALRDGAIKLSAGRKQHRLVKTEAT